MVRQGKRVTDDAMGTLLTLGACETLHIELFFALVERDKCDLAVSQVLSSVA